MEIGYLQERLLQRKLGDPSVFEDVMKIIHLMPEPNQLKTKQERIDEKATIVSEFQRTSFLALAYFTTHYTYQRHEASEELFSRMRRITVKILEGELVLL